MKVIRNALTVLCAILGFTSPALAEGWRAGAAKVDITPSKPIRLSGYGGRVSVSEGIEDRIHARALALVDETGAPTVLVSVDSIGIPAWVRERIVGSIRGRTGVYHVRFAITSTHSHFAPALHGSIPNILVMTPEEEDVVREYTDDLVEKCIEAIDSALSKLAPVTLEHGAGRAGFAKNRRTEGGPVDHDVPVLAARSPDGKLVAVVFNYACHATTMGGEFNRVSADWPGLAASAIEAAHAGAVALPLIGCGADANPHPRGDYPLSRLHGKELAAAVEAVLASPLSPLEPRLDAQLEPVRLRFARLPTKEELEGRLGAGPEHIRRHARLQLERIAREGKLPETHPYAIQVWALGRRIHWLFLPGEVVVDYATRLRKEIGREHLWVTAYANDIPCYIASRRVLGEGGYEADDSMYWYGQPTRWDPSVEDTIIEKAVALSRGLENPVAWIKPPPALEPEAALKSFEIAPDLRIELAAAEPEITDPVAIAFDDRGRMYAAEMRDYPLGPGEGKPFDGRVRLLEDADGDGRFERSTVFAERIPYANGIACSQGGVYVTAVPDLLFLADPDGDGRAEVRRTVFTGFRQGNSQHLVNSLARGPDGWLHANGGDAAALTCPEKPEMKALSLTGDNFRFHPVTLAIEPTTGYRGGFGITFTERGDRFVCDNQSHVIHVVLEQAYLSRNPDLGIDETMENPTDHGAAVFPASKTLERFNDPQDYGRFSSACGVHVYGGDALPGKYRGSHFSSEPVSNLVHRDVLEPSGATYIAKRAEEGTEFVRSTDHWFRPVNCATGPDGALYIVDMYREVIEHPEWIPEHIQKYFDLRSGMDRGRVYRVTAAAAPRGRKPDLPRAADTGALVGDLSHPNAWRRETAQRLLVERRDIGAADRVRRVLLEGKEPAGRLRALWTLEELGALGARDVEAALADGSPEVRANGVILVDRFPAASGGKADAEGPLARKVLALAEDPDARVRFQTALAVGTYPSGPARAEALAKIGWAGADDSWTRTAVLISTADPADLAGRIVKKGEISGGREELVRELCGVAGARKHPDEIRGLLELLTAGAEGQRLADSWRRGALQGLFEKLGREAVAEVLEAKGVAGVEIRSRLEALFESLADRARDDAEDLRRRLEAVDLLGYDAKGSARSLLAGLLESRYPPDLQEAAVRSLALARSPEVTAILLEAFPRLTPRVREEVLDALLVDTDRNLALIEALEKGDITPGDLSVEKRQRLLQAVSDERRPRVERVFAAVAADPDRKAVIESYRKAYASGEVPGSGDPARGKKLFHEKCSQCHKAGSDGNALGADLAMLRGKERDAILVDILDPSRAVAPEFQGYVLVTEDGRALVGLLALETPTNVVIRGPAGQSDTVLRRNIRELRATGKSAMPDGLEKELDPAALLDVLAFIQAGLEARQEEAGSPGK